MKKIRFELIAVLALFLISCTQGQRKWMKGFFKGGGSAVPVAVENVIVQEKSVGIVVPATLVPSEKIEVKLPNEVLVERVMVNNGSVVKDGEALCRLSTEESNLRLASLRAELTELQSNLEKNMYFLRNRDRLLDEGRINQDQYDNLETEVDENESRIEKTRAQIAELEAKTGEVNVTSPMAGIVQARMVSPGIVVPAGKPLFIIIKTNPIAAEFTLAPYEAKSVKAGMPVTIRFRDLPGEKVTAKISSVGSKIDPQTSRFFVRVLLPNPTGVYKTGMVAQAEFESAEKQRFYSISESAVIKDKRRHYVFTVHMGKAHRVPIRVRDIKNGRAEVIEGLMEGDIVVVRGNEELEEGAVVDIWGR